MIKRLSVLLVAIALSASCFISCDSKKADETDTTAETSEDTTVVTQSNLEAETAGSAASGKFTPPQSYKYPNGCIFTLNEDKQSYTLIEYTGTQADLTIPSLVYDTPVTAIAPNVFSQCKALKSVVISNGITDIGDGAFQQCSALESVSLPSTLIDLGRNTFILCTSLKSLDIPEGVTKIKWNLLYGCSSLESVTIPSTVTEIDSYVFDDCGSLKSIRIPKSVGLIGKGIVRGCSSLESITVEDGNARYHSRGDCLIDTEAKTVIGGCKTSVIPTDSSVETIGKEAFRALSTLTYIFIPDTVKLIDTSAFAECAELAKITVGSGLQTVEAMAFEGCEKLAEVTYNGSEEDWSNIEISIKNEFLISATKHYAKIVE